MNYVQNVYFGHMNLGINEVLIVFHIVWCGVVNVMDVIGTCSIFLVCHVVADVFDVLGVC